MSLVHPLIFTDIYKLNHIIYCFRNFTLHDSGFRPFTFFGIDTSYTHYVILSKKLELSLV